MNRYKKQLELHDNTNLPTMKAIYTKQGIHILTVDNFDIKNLKSLITELASRHSKSKTFTIDKCAKWSINGIEQKQYKETRTYKYKSITDIKAYLDHLRKVNKPNTIHMVYDNKLINNELVKVPMLLTYDCTIRIGRQVLPITL